MFTILPHLERFLNNVPRRQYTLIRNQIRTKIYIYTHQLRYCINYHHVSYSTQDTLPKECMIMMDDTVVTDVDYITKVW